MTNAKQLALLGGEPLRKKPFPPHPILGPEEKQAVLDVLESGQLSTFIARPGERFLGGKRIRQFEQDFAQRFGIPHAVAMNSATACLHAAVVALGVGPGDEVIVPPYTFTSTATCVLMAQATAVFADITDDIFCLDPRSVERAITPRTKGIILVHLFGQPGPMDEILAIAKRHNLFVIEDCAQAPGALLHGKPVGTLGDIGVFSFQETKNIMTGEGGMAVTRDSNLAERMQMVRNHGEVVLEGKPRDYNSLILGWNYRMTELEAALGIEQLKRLDGLNARRQELAQVLTQALVGLPGITPPVVLKERTHVYYIYAIRLDEARAGISRNTFVRAVQAEGIPVGGGYVRPLYLNPIFQNNGSARYEKGTCPVCERLHEREIVTTLLVRPPATPEDMRDIARAFEKVLQASPALRHL